jgi:hypothetical protein
MVPEGHNMRQGRHPTILLRATLGGMLSLCYPRGMLPLWFIISPSPVPRPRSFTRCNALLPDFSPDQFCKMV